MTAILAASSDAAAASAPEVDVNADTYHIVDGDTFDAFPVGRIRLADIDAPESYETGYSEASDALANLVDGQQVFLDVDDVGVEDSYHRLVAVVYVRVDSTHLLNVNEALVEDGYAVISDYSNEFDPDLWTRLVEMAGPDLPSNYIDALSLVERLQGSVASAESNTSTIQMQLNAKATELAASQQQLAQVRSELAAANASLEATTAQLAAAQVANGPSAAEYSAALQELNSSRAELRAARESANASESSHQATLASAASATNVAWIVAVGAGTAAVVAFFVGRRTAR